MPNPLSCTSAVLPSARRPGQLVIAATTLAGALTLITLSHLALLQTPHSPPPSPCQPWPKVAFAKTHKTGSSTLQNILLRRGDRAGGVFAFPADSWMFPLASPLNATTVLRGPWASLGGFDFFVSHSWWNKEEVAVPHIQ